jgi:protocadherin Fat 1/2/3
MTYNAQIRAQDNGQPQRSHAIRVAVQVASVPQESPHPPQVKHPSQHVEITESDAAGYLVALIQATDEDGDLLWYNIVGKQAQQCL